MYNMSIVSCICFDELSANNQACMEADRNKTHGGNHLSKVSMYQWRFIISAISLKYSNDYKTQE